MTVFIYTMFDRVSQTYGEPFIAVNDSVAQRRFQYVCSNSPMVCNDMQLFKLGTFDTDSGEVVADKSFVCNYIPQVDKE